MPADNIFAALLEIGAGNVAAAQPHLDQFHDYANARLFAGAAAAEPARTTGPATEPATAPASAN